MLYVTLAKHRDGLRSLSYTWSNVRETLVDIRIPEFFSVAPAGDICELHFKVTLAYVAIDILSSLDKALRSYQFCYIDEFKLDGFSKSFGTIYGHENQVF